MIKRLLILFFFFLSISSLFAKKEEYLFKKITVADGLSQTTIHCMLQDKKGFMWFGTGNGLNKYDGYKFTVYLNNPNDSASISENQITAMYEDRLGYIWIGTASGTINKFNRHTEEFQRIKLAVSEFFFPTDSDKYYDYPISFSRNNANTITSIIEDENGYLWFGTWGNGLFRYNTNNEELVQYFHNPNDNESISFNRISNIFIDQEGIFWIGTFGGGLNKYLPSKNRNEPSKFFSYKSSSSPNSLSDDKIISIYEDKYKSIWVGTYDGGLNKLPYEQKFISPNNASFTIYKTKPNDPTAISNNTVMSITGMDDNLWIGTFGGGLNIFSYETQDFRHFLPNPLDKNSLADNDVLSLYVDRSGILWVGTHLGEGINKLEKRTQKFNHIKNDPTDKNSLSDNVVWAIHQDIADPHIFWFATYRGGVSKLNESTGKFTSYKHVYNSPFSLSGNHVRSIAQDDEGFLWIGTYNSGLNKLNPKTNTFIRYVNNPSDTASIGANQVQDIYIDSSGTFYLCTFGGGLNTFIKNGTNIIVFKKYLHNPDDPATISDNRVYTIYEDSNNNFWIGTFGGGLNFFDKERERFTSFKNNPADTNSLSDNRVISINEDKNGNLWIGTFGGGLNHFNIEKKSFTRMTSKNINADVVYAAIQDDNENLWISSNNGILKYNIKTGAVIHYGLQDGLQSMEFSGGAYLKDSFGRIFFGGINGYNYFYPDSIKDNPYIPPVVVTNLKIFDKPLRGETKDLVLSFDENFLSFEFAALDFDDAGDNLYAYMLEGLNNNWQYTDASQRIATYTNLPPGDYVFRVKGSNNDGLWNEEGDSIKVSILPPFWQTWWFITLALLFISGSIYYVSTVRIRNLLAIEKIKSKLAADLHDDIGSGLTEISILSELAENEIRKAAPGNEQKLKNISEIARKLVDNMSDIVWVVNPNRDSLYDLIVRLKESYGDLLSSIGVSLKINNLEKLKNIKLPMDYRQNLYLIFKEGINNCIKHSRCKKIILDVNIRGDILEISLADDGVGMNGNVKALGNGIKNIETRANAIGGRMKWKSATNNGTTIRFVGRLKGSSLFRVSV